MSRWKASGIHLAISAALLSVLLAIIILLWYPGILFSVDGGWAGLRIVVGVDLVLGPLLTLVVFQAGKPSLKFDLTCIGLLQGVCMVAGMAIVYSERPVALVLAYDTIYSLSAQEFEDYGKDIRVLDSVPGPLPKLIYTELPENNIEAGIIAMRGQFIGDPLFIQTERYRPLSGTDLGQVFRQESQVRASVSDELRQSLPEHCLLAKFISSRSGGYVCFDSVQSRLSRHFPPEYQRATELPLSGENE